ncbi:MAG: CPBP family intramembrane metalloprotease [Oscillospiraceae bacterium]|nr:CPBP family intramembrane metalloprotease [Oscillospiraceae bacterium]
MKIELDDEIVLDDEIILDDDEKIDNDSSSYILDIAKSSSYQNQNVEYYNDYVKWRSKKNNKYGYAYVKDVREKTYVDGKGFVSDGPENAESSTLSNCFRLIAILLIISQVFTLLENFLIEKVMGYESYSANFFAYTSVKYDIDFAVVITYCAMNVLKLAVPILVFFLITDIPKSVVLPKASNSNYELTVSGIAFMLMATIFGRIANFGLSRIFALVGIRFSDFSFINTTDVKSIVLYAFCEYVVISILLEIFFRGIVLQLFRQYGDMFALLVSCITNVFFYNDFTMIGYIALTSVIIGLFTLRSGSIYTAIAMRVSARIVTLVVSLGLSRIDNDIAVLVEAIVSIVIISFALITYSRMVSKKPVNFNVSDSYTHLSTKTKFVIMFSSTTVIVWLVLVLLLMIFGVRFL